MLQPLPEWKWEEISMDFVTGLPKTTKQHDAIWVIVDSYQSIIGVAPYEMLYERKCRSQLHWDELVESKLLGLDDVQCTNEAIQKIRARMVTAQIIQKSYGDLRRRHIELEVGDHVFLRETPRERNISEKVWQEREVESQEDLSFDECPVKILDWKDNVIRNRTIFLVKVMWKNNVVEEATWELESYMLQ
ncbi:uncharacterized protein LOC133833192 [Humulus lupulus]|uniref:uncharacterized protein LOC133833192 n=1 Tax=Humulus lupulus TaxID=3486 RepID=UPI002B40C2B8|nr:uncharacterized protein LOC133833192 [Humulus lupulus]